MYKYGLRFFYLIFFIIQYGNIIVYLPSTMCEEKLSVFGEFYLLNTSSTSVVFSEKKISIEHLQFVFCMQFKFQYKTQSKRLYHLLLLLVIKLFKNLNMSWGHFFFVVCRLDSSLVAADRWAYAETRPSMCAHVRAAYICPWTSGGASGTAFASSTGAQRTSTTRTLRRRRRRSHAWFAAPGQAHDAYTCNMFYGRVRNVSKRAFKTSGGSART